MKAKTIMKKLIETVFYGSFQKKRTAEYWWYLHESAKKRDLYGYLKRWEYRKLVDKYNAFIPLETYFAGKPALPHGICGVFISSGARIGRNCTIFHQVTIGSNTLADSKAAGAPVIGDDVYIGCGAKIIGNVTVGDRVRIGANCVITEDIPSGCTVVMSKPRVIYKNNQHNSFIAYSNLEEKESFKTVN